MPRRNKFDIVEEILSTTIKPVGKTAVLYGANLNYKLTGRYLDVLSREGLLTAERGSAVKYKTTDRGFDFLRVYKALKEVANL